MGKGLYELEQIAGSGAHAVVCLATEVVRQQRVAVKVLRPQFVGDVEAVARFTDEARILMPIHHPDVIRVYRLLDYGGQPVIEMEPVEGVSVDQLLRYRKGGLPPEQALELTRRVAKALHAVFAGPYGPDGTPMRIVHRDVKPENILLSRDGRIKLLDFGTAKGEFDGRRARSLYSAPGSAGYTPPERRKGQHDHASIDVFALGVTLFVLLTGRALVLPTEEDEAARAAERQIAHLDDERVGALVKRMVAWDPDERPAMLAVAEELAQLIAAQPTPPDLAALGEAEVEPILDRRRGRSLAEDLGVVRFLEESLPTNVPETMTPDQAEAAVRALLADQRWERRWVELERIASASNGGVQQPLIEVLARGTSPWWAPWRKPVSAEQLVAALWILGDHPTDEVLRHAAPLAQHSEDRVRRAARFVLQRS
ncbi:MAG: serine/threonine protein kinase [Alphaproteobacteria bacterium]|nr:serine/threonine protein kinase [Alphaproteobacteria bacterium]